MNHNITLPSKPKVIKEESNHAIYEIDGFYPGYGHTIGNSLRRIILSSMPGVAITTVKIEGVPHEFSTIDGVKEDAILILLNLKKIRFKMATDEPQRLTLDVKGPKTVTAGDLQIPGQVEILNPEQHIADITGKISLKMEMTLEKGTGFVPKESLVENKTEAGFIALDASFSPIRRVNYEVENMRVGDRTDFNRLRFTIETDGTITAKEAFEDAVSIMIHQLKAIVGFQEEELSEEILKVEDPDNKESDKEVLKVRVDELELSARVQLALAEAGIRTLGGLVRKKSEDLLALPGLGEKGVQEVKQALDKYGLNLRS